MVQTQVSNPIRVYYHDTTTNNSFMKMHYFLKAKGIKNNKFFLVIYDPGLMGVDPRDPNLSVQMKLRILREVKINYWFFIREICRIPVEGGAVGSGARYQLTRANLAMNYLFVLNINQFVEIPRQHGKTVSALCWYLWVFNFGTANTKIMFANKKHDDAKSNLKTFKNLRAALPEYLQMANDVDAMGNKIKAPNTAEKLQSPVNGNLIVTLPGARNPSLADGAGRGATMAIQYYDEFAFLPYNEIVYTAAVPAFSRASQNAAQNGVPYGMLITTTPGDLTTKEGQYADDMRNKATQWDESFYDKPYAYEVKKNKKREVKANILKVSLITKVVRAEGDTQSIIFDGKTPIAVINADVQEYDTQTGVMTATGAVTIHYKELETFSNKAKVKTDKNGDLKNIELIGAARIKEKSNESFADRFVYDSSTDVLTAHGNTTSKSINEDGSTFVLKANYQEYTKAKNIFNASGNVRVWYQDYYAVGPKVTVYPSATTGKPNDIYMNGRSSITQGVRTIYADRIRMTVEPKDFKAEGNTRTVIKNIGSGSTPDDDNDMGLGL